MDKDNNQPLAEVFGFPDTKLSGSSKINNLDNIVVE